MTDPSGNAAARQAVTNSFALLTVSLLPTLTGQSAVSYFWIALGLGTAFIAFVTWLAISKTRLAARATVLASIVYLPLLLVAMVFYSLAP